MIAPNSTLAQTVSDDSGDALRQDIRLLGELLGEIILEQQGHNVFEAIESIRQLSVTYRRQNDDAARAQLETRLAKLSKDETISLIRAFSVFSMLSNLAEDCHLIKRIREHELQGSLPREGSLEYTFDELQRFGKSRADLVKRLADSETVAVLTAHPTEVQRKSVLDAQQAITQLIRRRDTGPMTTAEQNAWRFDLKAAVQRLYQTRLLRRTKLSVMDEVNNALSYFDVTFFNQLPEVYRAVERHLGLGGSTCFAQASEDPLSKLLRIASWIGGDRDGNPFVDAEVLYAALERQSDKVMHHYLAEVRALITEFSMTDFFFSPSPALIELAEASGEESEHRSDETLRRACVTVHKRLAATHHALQARRVTENQLPLGAYPNTDAFINDIKAMADALQANNMGRLVEGRLARLARSVKVFGFSLAPIDLRQNSDVFESVVHDLLDKATLGSVNYLSLDEAQRVSLLSKELQSPRLLFNSSLHYAEQTKKEIAIFHAAGMAHKLYGENCIRNCIISKTDSVSDMLELAVLLKEAHLLNVADAHLAVNLVPLFETIDDLQAAPLIMDLLHVLSRLKKRAIGWH